MTILPGMPSSVTYRSRYMLENNLYASNFPIEDMWSANSKFEQEYQTIDQDYISTYQNRNPSL